MLVVSFLDHPTCLHDGNPLSHLYYYTNFLLLYCINMWNVPKTEVCLYDYVTLLKWFCVMCKNKYKEKIHIIHSQVGEKLNLFISYCYDFDPKSQILK